MREAARPSIENLRWLKAPVSFWQHLLMCGRKQDTAYNLEEPRDCKAGIRTLACLAEKYWKLNEVKDNTIVSFLCQCGWAAALSYLIKHWMNLVCPWKYFVNVLNICSPLILHTRRLLCRISVGHSWEPWDQDTEFSHQGHLSSWSAFAWAWSLQAYLTTT